MDPRRGGHSGRHARAALIVCSLSLFALVSWAQDGRTNQDLANKIAGLGQAAYGDVESARRLEPLLAPVAERLRKGEDVGAHLAEATVIGALGLAASWFSGDERQLDNEACYDLADAAARSISDPPLRSKCLGNVAYWRGRELASAGRTAEALSVLEAALALDPQPGSWVPYLHTEAADLLRFEAQWDRSADQLERALEALPAPIDTEAVLRIEQIWMRLELDLGRLDLAWNHCERARALAEHLDAGDRHIQTLEEIVLLLACEDFHGAAERAEELLAEKSLDPASRPMARARRGLARLIIARVTDTKDPAAEEDLLAALDDLEGTERWMCLLRLADEALAKGDAKLADERVLEFARASKDEKGLTLMRSLASALSTRAGRAVEDPDGSRRRDDHERLVQAQRELLEEWAAVEPRPGGVGFLHFGVRTEALGELVTSGLELQGSDAGSVAGLAHLLDAQQQGSLARSWKLPLPTVAELQRALPKGRLLLTYLFAPHTSYVFAVDSGSVRAYPLESKWSLHEAIDAFAGRFVAPPSRSSERVREARMRATEALARELAERLLPGEVRERMLAADTVTVVGTNLLGLLPFEALHLPEDDRWLGAAVAIDHWPSIPVGLELLRRPGVSGDRTIAFVAPARGRDRGGPIAFTSADAKAWREAWPELELFSGDRATEERLREADPGSARAALFLTHGERDRERALPVGLELANGDVLWAEEVVAPLGPDLVVLGACGTGRGPQRRGEDGAAHFGGAWLGAGSRCVVLSAFALEEASTRRLIEELGRGLEEGLSVAQALRDARRTVAEEHPEPYYHQLLQVVGSGH